MTEGCYIDNRSKGYFLNESNHNYFIKQAFSGAGITLYSIHGGIAISFIYSIFKFNPFTSYQCLLYLQSFQNLRLV